MNKDYKAILARYNFKDEIGHPLENCADYLELLAEVEDKKPCASVTVNVDMAMIQAEVKKHMDELRDFLSDNLVSIANDAEKRRVSVSELAKLMREFAAEIKEI